MSNQSAPKNKRQQDYLSGSAAARFLGMDNHAAIAHLPIRHLEFKDRSGRMVYRYPRAELDAYRESITYGVDRTQ